jgi:hypothetical protein
MGDNFLGRNSGRTKSERDEGAVLGGTDWSYVWFPAGLATNGALLADGTAGPTITVAGTTAQSQTVKHAFSIAAKKYDHVNCLIPNDYSPTGGLYLIIPWGSAETNVAKKACWEHTWRVNTLNGGAVFDAAGTAGTMVKTACISAANKLTNSTITCPTAVSSTTKAGDFLHITFDHDYSQAENPGSTVDLYGGVILKYKRA